MFARGDDRALKLYRPGWGYETAELEARLARIAYDCGAPAPAVYGVMMDDGRPGILMDRVDGHPMSAAIDLARPAPVARALAELHARLHARRAPQLRQQHEELARRIGAASGLTPEQKRHAVSRLEALPQGDALCHGDFHLDNVVLTADGPVIIDWIDATRGDPLCDVARSLILIRHAYLHEKDAARQQALRAAADRFATVYVTHYVETTGADVEDVALWVQTNAAARMSEGIAVEQEALAALAALPE